MSEKQKKILVAWLNDAHAMEEALVDMLEKQAKEAEGRAEIQARITEHIEETKRHAELVERCLEQLDEKPSGTKDTITKWGAKLDGLLLSSTNDSLVKSLHVSYAIEHFEIATYTTLRMAADELDQPEIVSVCDGILEEEQAMAAWIVEHMPGVITEHLSRNA